MSGEITQGDLDAAAEYQALGPFYGIAKRVSERALSAFTDEHAKPLVDEIVKLIADKLWDSVQSSLWSDTEMNIQHQYWQSVDGAVKALLTGQKWALDRYALGSRYDSDDVRAAIAKHIPKELQDARIADLEDKIARLTEQLEWARR